MPLSPPAERELLHTRAITINGYRRPDGLYDIEAHLTDCKSFGQTNYDRGYIEAGEPIHDLWIRFTIDDGMNILHCEAASDDTPYVTCPSAAPNFSRLTGLQIRAGFLREANHRVGGAVGCTHLRELLQQVATTAYQTVNPNRVRREMLAKGKAEGRGSDQVDAQIMEKMGGAPKVLNTCLAYSADGPIVKRRWPALYTGPDQATTEPATAGD